MLDVLDARGIASTESARSRIVGSSDPDELGRWLRRAATAESVDDLFR